MEKNKWSLEKRLQVIDSSCPTLDTSFNSYTGSDNKLRYCNDTCNSTCPKGFNCADNCDRLVFLNGATPSPTQTEFQRSVIDAVKNCASTLNPGPVGCQSKITDCCVSKVDSNSDARNLCDIYAQGYCVNQSFTPPPDVPTSGPTSRECPSLDTSFNSYTGSDNKLEYCNDTCYSTCPKGFNCVDNCDRLVFFNGAKPGPITEMPTEPDISVETTTPGPTTGMPSAPDISVETTTPGPTTGMPSAPDISVETTTPGPTTGMPSAPVITTPVVDISKVSGSSGKNTIIENITNSNYFLPAIIFIAILIFMFIFRHKFS